MNTLHSFTYNIYITITRPTFVLASIKEKQSLMPLSMIKVSMVSDKIQKKYHSQIIQQSVSSEKNIYTEGKYVQQSLV